MEFSNWDRDNRQPDNWKMGEHCVHLRSSGTWNDLDCDTENFAICQNSSKSTTTTTTTSTTTTTTTTKTTTKTATTTTTTKTTTT